MSASQFMKVGSPVLAFASFGLAMFAGVQVARKSHDISEDRRTGRLRALYRRQCCCGINYMAIYIIGVFLTLISLALTVFELVFHPTQWPNYVSLIGVFATFGVLFVMRFGSIQLADGYTVRSDDLDPWEHQKLLDQQKNRDITKGVSDVGKAAEHAKTCCNFGVMTVLMIGLTASFVGSIANTVNVSTRTAVQNGAWRDAYTPHQFPTTTGRSPSPTTSTSPSILQAQCGQWSQTQCCAAIVSNTNIQCLLDLDRGCSTSVVPSSCLSPFDDCSGFNSFSSGQAWATCIYQMYKFLLCTARACNIGATCTDTLTTVVNECESGN